MSPAGTTPSPRASSKSSPPPPSPPPGAFLIPRGGPRRGAYGLYQGDTAARDNTHDRIVIFRDTLRRDFGHDPDLLRDQVTRTVRHELAHHVGFDELGVSRLDL